MERKDKEKERNVESMKFGQKTKRKAVKRKEGDNRKKELDV